MGLGDFEVVLGGFGGGTVRMNGKDGKQNLLQIYL